MESVLSDESHWLPCVRLYINGVYDVDPTKELLLALQIFPGGNVVASWIFVRRDLLSLSKTL